MKKILFILGITLLPLLGGVGVGLNAQVCFSAAVNYTVGAGTSPQEICSADFNNDTKPDLAVANYSGNNVSILLGTGTGTFTAAGNFTAGTNPTSVTNGYFNADAFIDLAVVNNGACTVSILLGTGTGSFTIGATIGLSCNNSFQIISADFNGDTKADLAIANKNSNTVSVLLGTGGGTFGAAVNFAVGTNPIFLTTADFNGDGLKDLATANYGSNNVSILINNGSGTFTTTGTFTVGTNPLSIINADFNGDGLKDLATANYGSNNVSVLLGTGTGSFGTAINYTVGTGPEGVISGDFNGDGKADLAAANYTAGSNVSVLVGNGAGSFGAANNFLVGTNPKSIIAADFNGDTKLDLAVANAGSNNVSILLNNLPNTNISGTTTICNGSGATLIANGANTYTGWSPGTSITVVNTSATSQTVTATPSSITTYTVSGTNTSCTIAVTNTITVNVNALPTITINGMANPPAVTICAGNSATLTAGGATTYTWQLLGTGATVAVTPNAATIYQVSGTDVNGCVNNNGILVNVNSLPTVTVSTAGVSTGGNVCAGNAITLTGGGITGGTYTWTNGVNNGSAFVPPSSHTYTVTGTDGNGCSNTASISITVNPLPTVTANATATLVCAGTSVTLSGGGIGGTGTYSWNDGNTSNLSNPLQVNQYTTQTYTVTGTDLHSCTNTATITINVNPLPFIQINGMSNNPTASICMGNTATLTVSGATTYTWQLLGTTATVTVSPTTTTYYNVQGTDGNGCVNSNGITVYANPLPNVTVNSPVICVGNSAILTATVSGGTSPYFFNWNTGPTTSTISINPSVSTNYTITVTDMEGCSGTAVSNVTVNPLPTILINGTNGGVSPVCIGSSIVLTASGGSFYGYTWNTTAHTPTISVSPMYYTAYNVMGVDAGTACTNTATIYVNVKPLPTISVNSATVCAGHPVILTASGASSYVWNTTATTATISVSPTVTTTYTVTGTDVNTCTNTAMGTVTAPANPMPFICMLTADSLALNNIIYWDRTLYANADSFAVYRYDVGSSSYLRLGTVSKDSSKFTDTKRNIGGPNGGDPQYGSWRYKLAVIDTCGDISAKSPYHQSVFVQENTQNFSWNAYIIEAGQSNPVSGYSFSRDDNNTGSWHVLMSTLVTSATDPNYATYPNGNWRVDALGFNCTPTMRLGNNSTQGAIVRSKSNITNNRTTKVNQLAGGSAQVKVYPNPSNGFFTIQSEKELGLVSVYNSLGEIVYHSTLQSLNNLPAGRQGLTIDISKQPAGIYILQTQGKHIRLIKE